jgi:hypothetical protein
MNPSMNPARAGLRTGASAASSCGRVRHHRRQHPVYRVRVPNRMPGPTAMAEGVFFLVPVLFLGDLTSTRGGA